MPLELVTFIVQNLVTQPDKLEIGAKYEANRVHIEIRCAPEDAGRIIGRSGQIINSIRTLARAAAGGQRRVDVHLIDT